MVPHFHKNRPCYGKHKAPLNTGLHKSDEQLAQEWWLKLYRNSKETAIKFHNYQNITMIKLAIIRRKQALKTISKYLIPIILEQRYIK